MNSWKEFELAGLKRVEISEYPLRAAVYHLEIKDLAQTND